MRFDKGYILHFTVGGRELWFTGIGESFTEDIEKAKTLGRNADIEKIQQDCVAVLEDVIGAVTEYGWLLV